MDKLLVDIDQVLDDLEESEKHQAATNYAFSQTSCLSLKDEISSIQNQSLHHVSSGDQLNDQSNSNPDNQPISQLIGELADESPVRRASIGTSASPFKIAPVNDSIYETNYEPTYESFRRLNFASTSSPGERSPNDEENYFDELSSNKNHDKPLDSSTNSAVADKSLSHSSNHHNDHTNRLSDNLPNLFDGEQSLEGGEEPNSGADRHDKPENYRAAASLSDTITCEQSKTQLDEPANEKKNANLGQQFVCDNLLLDSLLQTDDASEAGSNGEKNLATLDRFVQSDLESAVIRDKEISNAVDEQISASLKDELLIKQGKPFWTFLDLLLDFLLDVHRLNYPSN